MIDFFAGTGAAMDALYDLLLKLGLDPAVPIETCQIAGKTVHTIDAGASMVCLFLGQHGLDDARSI